MEFFDANCDVSHNHCQSSSVQKSMISAFLRAGIMSVANVTYRDSRVCSLKFAVSLLDPTAKAAFRELLRACTSIIPSLCFSVLVSVITIIDTIFRPD